MKNKFKKVIAALMATASLATGMVGMGASAANTADTYYTFNVNVGEWSGYKVTSAGQKENSTSVYARLDTTGKYINAQAQGFYSPNSHYSNYTSRGTVTLTSGSWEIYNSIYETFVQSGKYSEAYARLKLWAYDSNSAGQISGAYSPDCAGHYNVAN